MVRARVAVIAVATFISGCAPLKPDAQLAAFSTQLTGMNQVPPVNTPATGVAYAVLDKNTLLLRWKLSFNALSGPATAGHFHGPARIGTNAAGTVALKTPLKSPAEGQATLTPDQAASLLTGNWYLSIKTSAHPRGEIRGQIILRE